MGIRQLSFINGGALLALPVIIQGFSLPSSLYYFNAAICFAIGLASIMVSILCAYFHFGNTSKSLQARSDKKFWAAYQVALPQYMSDETLAFIADKKAYAENKQKRSNIIAKIWEFTALLFAVASLAIFITGSIIVYKAAILII